MRTGLTPAEALASVLSHTPVLASERVECAAALGRVLVEPVASGRDLPPSDNSAMDGFAVRAADLEQASPDSPVELKLAFEIHAGGIPERPLEAGECARILTGAPLPEGADSVVRQEDIEAEGPRVRFQQPVPNGEHVRRRGEDTRVGETILEAGTRIGAAETGMLAALGRSYVAVHRQPRVAILSGGDELVEPDGDVSGGRIVSSNSYSMAAQCRLAGAIPQYLGIARDSPEALEELLRAGLASDVLVSSAGVSVGDRDFVRPVLEKLGCRLEFWGVQMKPGYPLTFGLFPEGTSGLNPLTFGLPGNPVSAMVTFEQFVRPALLHMAGHTALHRPTLDVTVGETLRKKAGRLHFVRVTLERRGEEVVARSFGNQSSGVLRSMCDAQALLIFPAEASELPRGGRARVQLLDETFLASRQPAF